LEEADYTRVVNEIEKICMEGKISTTKEESAKEPDNI